MLLWATDLHFDTKGIRKDIVEHFGNRINEDFPLADGLIISGDISSGLLLNKHLTQLSESFDKPIYFVLGNHDFFGSSFKDMDVIAKSLTKKKNLHWLQYNPTTIGNIDLIGVGGWYDAYHGNTNSKIALQDWYSIIELMPGVACKDLLFELIRKESSKHADILRRQLKETKNNTIIIVTHVPPYKESSWHEGEESDSETWLPWMTSASTGVEIDRYASNNKDKKIIVLCGHTHSPGIYIRDNVTVYTGKAEYGDPQITGEIYEDKIVAFDSTGKKVENNI